MNRTTLNIVDSNNESYISKRTNRFFSVIFACVFFLSLLPVNTKAQIVDTIFTGGWLTAIEVINNKPGEILIGDMGTLISKTTDYGQTWVASEFDSLYLECYDISFNQINTEIGFMGGASSLYKTTDGGYNWFNTNQLELIYLVDVNPFEPNIIFAQKAGDSGFGPFVLFRSADYGETWQDSTIHDWIRDIQFNPTNDSIAYGYNYSSILKTTDFGRSWQSILNSNSLSFTALAVSESYAGTLYACKDGLLYKTTNDGDSWRSKVIPPTGIKSILLDNSNPGRLYVGSKEGLFLTEDDGAEWKQIHYQSIYLIKADKETPRNIYCVTNYEKTAIKFVDTFTVTGVNEQQNLLTDRFFLFQNYPNPFSKGAGGNTSTTINYSLKENGFVQLKVYDVLGKEISTLVSEEISAGNYSVKFDGHNLPSGIYFYVLRINDFVQHRKMILLR